MEKVKEYLDEHFAKKIKLDELSEQSFINKYYLTRIFKDTYGSTIIHYVFDEAHYKSKATDSLLRYDNG